MKPKITKAMILAAGFGTRLRPLTNNVPKPLLPVGGKPIIYYVIECLKQNGIEEIVINLHYLGNLIRENLGDGKKFGLKIVYTEEKEILGTGGGIKNAEKYLKGDRFIVMNSDILVRIDLLEAIEFHIKMRGIATLIVRAKDIEKYNILSVDENDRIVDIAGITGSGNPANKKGTFAGIHIIEPEIFQYLPPGKSSITDCYIKMIREGKNIYGFFADPYWRDIGNIEDYERVNKELALKIGSS